VTQNGIPDDARRLLAQHINSVEQLEILLLLRRRPDESWTAAAVAEELRTSELSATKRLHDLRGRGFLTSSDPSDEAFRYGPATDWLRNAVDRVSELYAERPHGVIDLIFSKPIDNLRVYADAFRYRKDDSDG
jgi:hypothetical protein